MKKSFIKPEMRIVPIAVNENIASSSSACSLGREYSAGKQECQNCKIYHTHYGSLPSGIDFSGAIMTFSNTYGLGYANKDSALAAANALPCPEGLI